VDDFVKLQLGFGERDFAVNSDAGLLYDPDETDNLDKLLSELGIDENSFVTIVDEEENEPFINVVLNIQSLPSESTGKPIKGLEPDKAPEIPHKPKKEPTVETNGTGHLVRPRDPDSPPPKDLKRLRADDGDTVSAKKRAKMVATDEVVTIDDDATGNGAITIEDD
jgi:ubiquitin-like 1-activating enzyme E1 B